MVPVVNQSFVVGFESLVINHQWVVLIKIPRLGLVIFWVGETPRAGAMFNYISVVPVGIGRHKGIHLLSSFLSPLIRETTLILRHKRMIYLLNGKVNRKLG
jgi:hypothetical protein